MEEQSLQRQEQSRLTEQQAAIIESLLFVAGRPLTRAELRKLLEVDEERLETALEWLAKSLRQGERGIRLQLLGEQVQLVTAPENARYVAALLGLPMTAKLTPAALETLAVISYRQPITRAQIEAVRGVNSDRALASLLQYGLVAEIGRAQTVGRPALFATTPEFLQFLACHAWRNCHMSHRRARLLRHTSLLSIRQTIPMKMDTCGRRWKGNNLERTSRAGGASQGDSHAPGTPHADELEDDPRGGDCTLAGL